MAKSKGPDGDVATLEEIRGDIHEFRTVDENAEDAAGRKLSPTEAARAKAVRVQLPHQPYAIVESLGDARWRVTIPDQSGFTPEQQPVEVVADGAVQAYSRACGILNSIHEYSVHEHAA